VNSLQYSGLLLWWLTDTIICLATLCPCRCRQWRRISCRGRSRLHLAHNVSVTFIFASLCRQRNACCARREVTNHRLNHQLKAMTLYNWFLAFA